MKCEEIGEGINKSKDCSAFVKEENSNMVKNTNKKTLKELFVTNKKGIVCSLICIFFLGVFIFIYAILFGFEKLEWDEKYKAVSLDYVTQSNLKIGFDISDRKKAKDVKVNVTCGSYEIDKREITWNLNDAIGKCEIEISYKMKKIKKEFTIVPAKIENEDLALIYDIDLDSDEDLDYDGLTNKQEKEYGTNPLLADTDMDGLDDNYEISVSKTDPLKVDTDEDGLSDYDEVELGLDPLKVDSKGDGTKDGERKLSYNYKSDGVNLSVTGKGNIASSVVNVNKNIKISSKNGMIDKLYSVYTESEDAELTISISYTDEELNEKGIIENNLEIYYYKVENEEYEKIDSKLDRDNKLIYGKVKKGGNYVVGDGSKIVPKRNSQILFVLDNSWSMYSNDQYKEITGDDYSGILDSSDDAGLRFTLTNNLVEKLSSKGHQIGLSEFRSDYANISKIGTNKSNLKKNIDKMYGNFTSKFAGTNIRTALESGMNEFDNVSDYKYIILLTDGQDNNLKSSSSRIIEKAIEKNVKICSIGFGEGVLNAELANISNATGCNFFSSSDSSGLEELFDNVETELSDDLVDIDNDGESDAILLADSGFIASRDGFSFKNYSSDFAGGHCYGMATFAELYYLKKLPLKVDSITVKDDKSYNYDLTNTYFKNYGNLYSYKLKTNELKYIFGFETFGEENPSDLRILDGNDLVYSKDYRNEIKNIDLLNINKTKSGLSSEKQIEKYGFTYENVENINLNEAKMQDSEIINNEDKQMFNAIYTSFIKQGSSNRFISSSMDFTLWLRDLVDKEQIDYKGEEGFINVLKARLSAGDPVVIASDFYGLHAINAISLLQDANKPNYYYIGVYDNNYPGEKRYVELECKKGKCVTVGNDYFSNSNQPIRMTASLEYDLDYYKDYVK